MASDYAKIRDENRIRYGTDIGRIGPMLLANRYADRTHFIFELLQNAEDALSRRSEWNSSRSVTFTLSKNALTVSHCGKPFDEPDVRGICGIAESTKGLTDIGRFGIGFKSVYAFTTRPEVHSGEEDFAIESFVWPIGVPPLERSPDETLIVLPLDPNDTSAHGEIAEGLQRLGRGTLLFLRQIEEISWNVEGGASGFHMRTKPKALGEGVQQITVVGQQEGRAEFEETWLVFSTAASTDDGAVVGQVEVAFSINEKRESLRGSVQSITESRLVVFFPTVLDTHLGFLIQGPYRTTPSRDNVPPADRWNQYLIGRTATLLLEALRWLRDNGMLDTVALGCLPLDAEKFGEGSMFAPLFEATRTALSSEPLLPGFGGGYVPASIARLARTQELRTLFSPSQLASLLGQDGQLMWLSADITQDRTPELRTYLINELDIDELTPETMVARLSKPFLESQSDEWILDLYEFLNGQRAVWWRLKDVALIRLEDGTHVVAHASGQPQAFLPGQIKTGFPTVRPAVCGTEEAREFLRSQGLTECDPVDDVIRNVLPRYQEGEGALKDADYEVDIQRILAAFATDSKTQRDKLVGSLRGTTIVMAVDAGDGSKYCAKPSELYLATERLKELFAGVQGVLLVDDSYACLRGEDVRELLEACGATRYLQPIPVASGFTWDQLSEMRTAAGCENISSTEAIEDHTLRGLDNFLNILPEIDGTARGRKASLLWEALGDVEDRRGTGTFSGSYRWYCYYRRSTTFDAAFVRKLNDVWWVPDSKGDLQRPDIVLFESLGWKANPFLQSKIRFKPPIIETLAREAGIEPGVLDLLKKLGVTSEAELRSKLGIKQDAPGQLEPKPDVSTVGNAIESLVGGLPDPTPPPPDLTDLEKASPVGPTHGKGGVDGSGHGKSPEDLGPVVGSGSSTSGGKSASPGANPPTQTPGKPGALLFVSYLGTHPSDEDPDPDGLTQQARLALEEKAIKFILQAEPQLQRTPALNPGYDLFEAPGDGEVTRWIEVKAMTGSLEDRPVGVSHTQFDCAREHREAYWLYVVEQAGDDKTARILRVQDPAGKARTFTFDRGWRAAAESVAG